MQKPPTIFRLLAALLLIVSLGCDSRPSLDLPLTDFPEWARVENWGRYGSCAYADLAATCELNGFPTAAEQIRTECIGGAGLPELEKTLTRLGIPYQSSNVHDLGFIRRACESGRCCVVGMWCGGECVPYSPPSTPRRPYGHALIPFYADGRVIGLYDCNHCMYQGSPIRFVWQSDFAREWQGWAVTPYAE